MKRCAIALVLLLSVVGTVQASRNERIQFKVVDTSTGQSFQGVLVTIETSAGEHFDGVTGPSGLVSVTFHDGGTMDVLITAPNYQSVFMDDAQVVQGRYFIQMVPLQ